MIDLIQNWLEGYTYLTHVSALLDFLNTFFMDFDHFNLAHPSRKLCIYKIKFEHTKPDNDLIRNLLIIKKGIWQT